MGYIRMGEKRECSGEMSRDIQTAHNRISSRHCISHLNGGGAEHEVLGVAERLGGSHNNGVSCVYPQGIEVLHVAHLICRGGDKGSECMMTVSVVDEECILELYAETHSNRSGDAEANRHDT